MTIRGAEEEGIDEEEEVGMKNNNQKARRSQQTARKTEGWKLEKGNDCLRLISPHMSPSVQLPGWDGTTALTEMTKPVKDSPAPQEAKCNPQNPGLVLFSPKPFSKAFFFFWLNTFFFFFTLRRNLTLMLSWIHLHGKYPEKHVYRKNHTRNNRIFLDSFNSSSVLGRSCFAWQVL